MEGREEGRTPKSQFRMFLGQDEGRKRTMRMRTTQTKPSAFLGPHCAKRLPEFLREKAGREIVNDQALFSA
jgi:hypothetical protein